MILILASAAACHSGQGDYVTMVTNACQAAVTQRLKAPRTAQFASVGETRVNAMRPGERYDVVSHVDAQNAFGALIRKRYRCEVEFTGIRGAQAQVINLIVEP